MYENDQINKTLRVVEFKDRIELDTFFSKQSKLRNLICGEESNLSVLVVFPSGETSIIYGKMDSDKTLITSRSKSVVKFGDLSHGLNKLNIAATMQG